MKSPVVLVLIGVVVLALGLHLASGYTGPLEIAAPAGRRFERGVFALGDSRYPRRLADHEGYSLTIKRPARRIASLEWGIDDFVYTVAAPETVVAVNDSAYQRRISNVIELAERYRPVVASTAEAVLKADPDLAIAAGRRSPEFAEILAAAGIATHRTFTLYTKLEEVAKTILLTGYLTGRDEEARRAYDEFQAAVARARTRKPQDAPPPRILGFGGRYSYGDETLFNDIVRTLGGVNVGAENGLRGYDAINTEQVLRWDPEWIVAGADLGTSEQVLRRFMEDPALRATTAARKGQIVVFEHKVFLAMSPFTRLMLDALGDALYSGRLPD